ncbi:MAG: pyruvate kinase [Ktedonobacterales bacterium]
MQHLRQDVYEQGERMFQRWQPYISQRSFVSSARNLAYYLALRRNDLRDIQAGLAPWGLSSLGRSESRVLATLDAVIATLGALSGEVPDSLPPRPSMSAFTQGMHALERNTDALFGKTIIQHRSIRIMATLPTEAATEYSFVHDLVHAGVDCVRINCAHDTQDDWAAMIANLRRAENEMERHVRIAMDLGGPKPRIVDVRLPEAEARMHVGDRLFLARTRAQFGGRFEFQATCSIPEVLDQVKEGELVWIDDGKIGTAIESILPEGILLRVTHARRKGERLAADKGLNFPDSAIDLSPLTEKDWHDLDFVVRHADIIDYSFVQKASDMDLLLSALPERLEAGRGLPAVIAKIETKQGVHNLPDLVAHTAGRVPFGVMIARGDLAVEVGFERLAEIQEEMLWLCEAAHVPVIWATEVLETLIKKGIPSRAEITDAAMSERAECVMLNKGPYLPLAVETLHNVLLKMQTHQSKKTAQLRALHMWQDLF